MNLEQIFHENLEISAVNAEPFRSFYVPMSSECLGKNHFESDRAHSLNGIWNFEYYDSLYYVPEEILTGNYNLNLLKTIQVPSTWQSEGYDRYHYSNLEYCIPFNPPYVPAETPCGLYIKEFNSVCDDSFSTYITFEGVDSCCYIWLNGSFVGYHQISHSFFEYDVTTYLKNGINRLIVLVLKWCDGTYLECQDKMRLSGIFGNVTLIQRPVLHIKDYFIRPEYKGESRASICIDIDCPKELKVFYSLHSPMDDLISKDQLFPGHNEIIVDNPILWNDESPNLYTLELYAPNEKIIEKIGIRYVSIENGIFKLNGEEIKLHGVNRHEVNPLHGYSYRYEEIENEIKVMKCHNVNAIRTSHYPSNPYLYYLCDKYGIYVIDEADVEGHGIITLYGARNKSTNGTIADNPSFLNPIMFRELSLVSRDKNRCCIIIWSMGNETGYGENMMKCVEMIHNLDSTRPVNYESSTHPIMCPDIDNVDIVSRMYLPIDELVRDLEKYKSRKPILLTEYCHCMGNSPGDFEAYHKQFYSNPGLMGGCVWEWRDQSMLCGYEENGKPKYLYGGDYGDYPNCGNFCVDGITYPDGKPHTGLEEHKNVYRPLRFIPVDLMNGQFSVVGYSPFADYSEQYEVSVELSREGIIIDKFILPCPALKYNQKTSFNIPYSLPDDGRCYIKLSTISKINTDWANKGFEIGFDQFRLPTSMLDHPTEEHSNEVAYTESGSVIEINCACYTCAINKIKGEICSIKALDSVFTDAPADFQIWRAPIDNDRYVKTEWQAAGYDRIMTRVKNCDVVTENGKVCVNFKIDIGAVSVQNIALLYVSYVFSSNGVDISMELHRDTGLPFLPRFGIRLAIPESFFKVEYFGYGPYESYCDKHQSSFIGKFETTVDELFEDYVVPQENGSHCGCEDLSVYSELLSAVITADKPFCFNLSRYSAEQLTEKKHSYELNPEGKLFLSLDVAQSGIGSGSCGPELAKEFRIDDNMLANTFHISFRRNNND